MALLDMARSHTPVGEIAGSFAAGMNSLVDCTEQALRGSIGLLRLSPELARSLYQ